MHIGTDGWAVEDAQGLPPLLKIPSVRTTKLAADIAGPLGIVWHWTAGPCRNPETGVLLANEIRSYNPQRDRAASWHFLVAKDGRIIQSVPTTMGSWHVGRPGRLGGKPTMTSGKWDASAWPGRLFANVNSASVGVELENAGRLEQVNGKFYCWPFWLDPDRPESGPDPKLEIPATRAVQHEAQWFDGFPVEQEMAASRLLQALSLRHKWTRDVAQYGHVMFDPSRKEDPGPVWLEVVLPRILDRCYGADVG